HRQLLRRLRDPHELSARVLLQWPDPDRPRDAVAGARLPGDRLTPAQETQDRPGPDLRRRRPRGRHPAAHEPDARERTDPEGPRASEAGAGLKGADCPRGAPEKAATIFDRSALERDPLHGGHPGAPERPQYRVGLGGPSDRRPAVCRPGGCRLRPLRVHPADRLAFSLIPTREWWSKRLSAMNKRSPIRLSRDEELFLLHWMYDEVHY